jgi:TonB family protein
MKRVGGTIWRLRDGDAAMAISPSWRDEPPQSRASRWRERLGWVAGLSLLIHAAIVALMFLAPAPPRPPVSDQTPPGEVALVFQGGSKTAPSAPNPSPETTLGPPSPETAPSAPPAGAVPPPQAAPAPPPPAVAQAGPSPPVPAPPVPPPPVSASSVPTAPAPPPVPLARAAPPRRPEPVRPRSPPRPRAAPPNPDAFPRPLNFAFNGSVLDGHGSVGHAAPHESLGPVQPGPSSRSAFNSDISGDIGPDYRNLLRNWMERHKYYPPQAAEEGEDGTASVRVVVRKDGSVRVVELEQRSGSQWLDMGAQAIFRGQRLPPFPNDAMGDEQELYITIHYVLIRG